MRVLNLITHLNPGGIERWLLTMMPLLRQAQVETDFCCKGGGVGRLAPAATALGARVIHCPLDVAHVGFTRRLSRILDEGGYDLVHNHLELYSGIGCYIAREARLPVVTSYHNTRFAPQAWTALPVVRTFRAAYGRLSVAYALRHSDAITGCSESVLAALRPDRASRAERRVIYYGVDVPPRLAPAEHATARSEFGWTPGSPVVIHVGRFLEQKNHRGLLRVWTRVHAARKDARLLLVGDGPLRRDIEHRVRTASLDGCVHFAGLRDDVDRLLGASDVLLFPSRHEGFGLAALEANAAGLPVVGSSVDGLREAVEDGATALLHDVNDVDGMAGSVLRLLDDRELARRLGEAGRERARTRFSRAAAADSLVRLYRDTISATPAR